VGTYKYNHFKEMSKNWIVTEEPRYLSAFDNPIVESLEHGVKAITFNSHVKLFPNAMGPNTLYERWWYEDLFKAFWSRGAMSDASKVLIGNPGTSKSTWQFWFLFRLVQSSW
jgi:hypothetical protein